MKVVILHDWLVGFRGGERVLEALCEMFPDAPIYTLLHKKGSTSPTIESKEIVTSLLDKIPGIYENYRYFLPIMPLATTLLKIKHDADIVISSSHCVIKGVKKPKKAKHICYIHSPMRYIYDQFDNYFDKSPFPIKIAANLLRPYLSWWDRHSNKNVDLFLPNSRFVQSRVQKYYHSDCYVVHPFVDLQDFTDVQNHNVPKKDFYLMVTAFSPNKMVDVAIKAFNELNLPLKIIGGGSPTETKYLQDLAKDNIEFLGFVERSTVIKYMSEAKGFIFPGIEDFGIAPLEALASGTPVIALKEGGVLETLNDNVAHFFTNKSVEGLIEAVKTYHLEEYQKEQLFSRARIFSKQNFAEKLTKHISDLSTN